MRQTTLITRTFLCLGLAISPSLLAEINITPPLSPPATQAVTPAPAVPAEPAVSEAPAPVANEVEASTSNTPLEDEVVTTPDGFDPRAKIKDAVVKVHVVQHTYDTLSPWNSDSQKGSGSGLIIADNLILTNAHVASDATFLEIQRHSETKRYEAEVVYISHESDLAILRTKDASAYKDVTPLELGDLPKMQQSVEVYGFPIGGNTLSVTRGVVSRIEKQNYVHTGENLIAVQVDAAINFGNSGGPVISNGKVIGVAMQSGFLTENIGYMIPTPIIRHVLADVKDGKVDGYGFHGFLAQSMENPAMRRKYGLGDTQTGMLVHKVYKNSPADGKVQIGDIVTEIDGHKIENNGTVEFRPGEFIDHTHYIDMHQIGESIAFKILRNGQEQLVNLPLDKPGKEYLLVKPNQYDKQPTYFIFGGLVFMPLNQDVIDSMDGTPARIGALTYESPDEKRSEAVILTKVLPADINKDYHHDNNLLIEKVNGESIRDFNDFYQKIQSSNTDYITLETSDHYQLVIDRKEAIERQPKILAQYGVNADRSKELQAIAQPPATPVAEPVPATIPAAPAPATAVVQPAPAVIPAAPLVMPAPVATPPAPLVVPPQPVMPQPVIPQIPPAVGGTQP
ncbi:S1C family serine protease [Thiothrix subterranea]|uniref:Serine protease n=1 Tax=Thiothrix subterranea TaxID=2735563 RepID=A0AA51MQ80_9GAMM|nr:serine protease [Thiothrix subterranea]MDQ5769082.1 serine protease [Thiothrix subterranea]WML88360.1 serine protease [Thiothrix subterranea]